jgi:N12 class adenine-specific DNA methylase
MQATLVSKVETQLEELKQAAEDMFTAAMRFEDYRGLNDVLAAASDMLINDKSLEKLMSDVKEKLVARRKEKEDMLQASNLEMESLSLDESGDVTSQGHSDDA